MGDRNSEAPLTDPVKIAVIDDHKIFLAGLTALFGDMIEDCRLIPYEDPIAFLAHLDTGEQFSLIICDLIMKRMNGFAVVQAIREQDGATPILVLSGVNSSDPVKELIALGASGFVHKSAEHDVLAAAIRSVLEQKAWFPDLEAENDQITQAWPEHSSNQSRAASIANLNDRPLEVVQYLAQGATNKEISQAMSISENTVKTYIRQLFQALGVNTRTACVRRAQLLGLV